MGTRIMTSASKVLRAFKALKGHTLNGLSNIELAKALNESAPQITRVMETLISEWLAQRLDNGRYALSIAALQIAQAHATEMASASARIAEINRRVVAGAL